MTTRRANAESLRTGGFTLIEVLAALVIVALGMLGVIEAVSQSARNGTYLREKTLAHWIALNVITETRLKAAAPPVGETSDEVEYAGTRWHWTMKVSQTAVESMRRMDVSVRQADAPEKTALTSVAGFYGTAVGPAGGQTISWQGGADGGGSPQGGGRNPATDGQPSPPPPAEPAPLPEPIPPDTGDD
jgi:general secretion pathway protein I